MALPPYPPRSPSFASLLRADGASRMHVFVDPRPRYVGNTRVPWGRGEILPLSVLFVSSAMHCLQTSTRFVSLGYCPGEKMKFLPPPSDGIFLSGERGWITLAFRGFPSSSKLFFHGPCAFLGSSRLSGLWVFMASEFRYDKEFGVWIMLYITLWIIVIAIYREDKFIK